MPFFLGQRPVPVLVRSREHPSHLVRIMIIMIKMMIYDNIMIRISWLSLDHTHTLCTRYKLDRPFFDLLLLISWTTLLASCKLKKHFPKRDFVFMLVSFSIVSFSLALCGRRPRTRGLFSPSSKRTLHQPFLTSPHQLECEAAFFHTQSQRKRRKGLYNVDFGFGSFSP